MFILSLPPQEALLYKLGLFTGCLPHLYQRPTLPAVLRLRLHTMSQKNLLNHRHLLDALGHTVRVLDLPALRDLFPRL